jgi:predicted nucleotidyltransferase
MPRLDLPAKYRQTLRELLAAHVPDAEVWAYGSRINEQAHEGSDLDLVVRNPDRLTVPQPNLYRLRDALTESDLPILVEVLDWARITTDMRQEIEREHVVIATPVPANTVAEARAKYGKEEAKH